MFSGTRIVTRLFFGFALMVLGALVLGFLGARSITQLSGITTDIFRHPFAVTTAILEIRADVLATEKLAAGLVAKVGTPEALPLEQRLAATVTNIERNMATVRERFQGSSADVARMNKALVYWNAARNDTLARARGGHRTEAAAFNDTREAPLVEAILREIDNLAAMSAARAADFERTAAEQQSSALGIIAVMLALIVVGGILLAFFVTDSIKRSLQVAAGAVESLIKDSADKVLAAEAVGAGDLSREITVTKPLEIDLASLPRDELGFLMKTAAHLSEVQAALDEAFLHMTESLRQARDAERDRDWLKTGRNDLNALMREEQGTAEMADKVLAYLAEYLQAGVGALYLFDERNVKLVLTATYATAADMQVGEQFRLGESLIGQAARQQKILSLTDVPAGYLPIGSALGGTMPTVIIAIPLLHGNRLIGVIELGTFRPFNAIELKFLELISEWIAIGFGNNLSRKAMAELLEETEQQAEELRVQQEELQQSNEELEERAQLLEQQREAVRVKSREVETASELLQQKVAELERVSTYKSEFLANMSHELRTPLNSLMILSSLLKQNKDGNLTQKQVEFASTIHSAGSDLLELINDILDLSKVEAGQMQFNIAALPVADLCDATRALFEPIAAQKGLSFGIDIEPDVPPMFTGDEQRVHQIVKNLLSNAFKFTEKGGVSLRVATPAAGENPLGVPALAFAVSDSGIGIPREKQQLVFEAFQQADGSISRKYGGTGLGLSISLQLARKMRGEIRMTSEEGKGSVFTLYMPLTASADEAPRPLLPAPPAPAPSAAPRTEPAAPVAAKAGPLAGKDDERRKSQFFPAPIPDDREQVAMGDKSILIIEDDLNFARILHGMVKERGFAALVAADGESGIALADRYLPSAVLLDVMLPHIDGWGVMRSLKDNARTRHIPVHFITCLEDRHKAMAMGAIGFVTKPTSVEQLNQVFQSIEGSLAKSMKRLLIVEDNPDEAKSMVALLEEGGVDIAVATSGKEAIGLLGQQSFDCLVLDLGLSDMSGFELLDHIQQLEGARRIPVIIHSGRDLTHEDERRLRHYAESIIIKGAKSPERLLNEVTLFLHLVESNLHPSKQRMIRTAIDKEAALEGRKVLLVDDDMRNIFSLSSVLAEKNMVVIEAENGKEAIARLGEHDDIGIVLMDIMMPEMDGYTAMREIRKNPRHVHIPIIAMTAKALKGDHEKCMAAGASDYISKPIEVEKLLSLIRVWIFQHA